MCIADTGIVQQMEATAMTMITNTPTPRFSTTAEAPGFKLETLKARLAALLRPRRDLHGLQSGDVAMMTGLGIPDAAVHRVTSGGFPR
jgi:hypothetical protein